MKKEEVKRVDFHNLTDKQHLLLMKLAQYEFDYGKIWKKGYNLHQFINGETDCFSMSISQASKVISRDNIKGAKELFKELKENGLGDLRINHILSERSPNIKNAVNAIALMDYVGNTAIVYSSPKTEKALNDKDDHLGQIAEISNEEVEKAIDFFDKYSRNWKSNNFLLGYSAGGTLAAQVYSRRSKNVEQLNTINAPLIEELDEDSGKGLNNNPKCKFDYTEGDIFGFLAANPDNVRYIKKEEKEGKKDSLKSNHSLEGIAFNDKGNFEYISREEAYNDKKFTSKRPEKYMDYIKEISVDPEKYKSYSRYLKELAKREGMPTQFQKIVKSTIEKTRTFFQDLLDRAGNVANRIIDGGTKLLPAGRNTEGKKEENKKKYNKILDDMEIRHNEKTASSDFRTNYQPEAYVDGENYTNEQAKIARELSNNPQELINKTEQQENVNSNQEKQNEEPDEPGEL